MRPLIIAVLAVAMLVTASDDENFPEPDVKILTESNFDATVNNAELILVEFYAPWCGHCKHLKKPFSEAATALSKLESPVLLGKVDATVESSLASKHGVSGYPTLKVFRKGVSSPYNGPRDTEGIVAYMKKQVGPSSRVITSVDAMEKFLSEDEASVVYFYPAKGSNYKTYSDFTNKNREKFRFAESDNADVLAHYNVKESTLAIFRASRHVSKLDEPKAELTGKFTESDLEKFVWGKALPLVSEMTDSNREMFTRNAKALVTAYFKVDFKRDAKGTNYMANKLRKAVKDFVGEDVRFAIANKESFSQDVQKFGLGNKEAGIVIDDIAKGRKHLHEGAFEAEDIKKFLQRWQAGELEPFIKSEPVPAEQGPVKTIVGKNFESIVMDDTKDVLLEMYAPWCGHCKSLAPTWDKLGEHFKDAKNVVIAKMDATANDASHAAYSANGYPTIYWSPAGKKTAPQKYDGGRDLNELVEYVNKHATGGVKYAKKGKKGKEDL